METGNQLRSNSDVHLCKHHDFFFFFFWLTYSCNDMYCPEDYFAVLPTHISLLLIYGLLFTSTS